MVPTNARIPEIAMIGAASGRIIPKKICAWLAPSIVAASSSSLGMVSKKPFISQVETPSAPPM
ncbi:hypothetical protein GCM10029992_17170 [Glycomyces albus]